MTDLFEVIDNIHKGIIKPHKVIWGSKTKLILDDNRSTEGIPFVTEYNHKALKKLNSMQGEKFRVEPIINYPYRSEVTQLMNRFKIELLPYRIDFLLWDFDKPSFEMWMDGNQFRVNAKSIYFNKLLKSIKIQDNYGKEKNLYNRFS